VVVGDGRLRQWVADEIAKRHLGANLPLVGPQPSGAHAVDLSPLSDALLITLTRSCIAGADDSHPSCRSYLACGRPHHRPRGPTERPARSVSESAGYRSRLPAGRSAGLAGGRPRAPIACPPAQRSARWAKPAAPAFEQRFERRSLITRAHPLVGRGIGGPALCPERVATRARPRRIGFAAAA